MSKTLHYGQSRLLYDDTHRDHLILAGVGYGKTHFGPPWHFRRVLINDRSKESMIIAPTNKLLKKCLEFYTDFLRDTGLREGRGGHFTVNKSDPSLTFHGLGGRTPHTVWFISAEAPERIISYTVSHVWGDEAALWVEQVKKNLYKRLRCPSAKTLRQVLYTTTPEGLNWLYEQFNPDTVIRDIGTPFSESSSKLILHGSSHDNPYLDEEYLVNVLQEEFGWDADYYSNYVLGEWVSLSKDRFYFSFDTKKHVGDFPIDTSNETLCLTFDNNVGRMAWAVLQNQLGVWVVVAANRANARNVQDATDQVVQALPPQRFNDFNIVVYGDATLHNRSNQTFTTAFQVLESALKKHYHRVKISAPRGNPLVEERSRRTNSLFASNRLFIDRKCLKVIESAKATESDGRGGIKKPADDKITHSMESVDHALMALEPLKIDRYGTGGVSYAA